MFNINFHIGFATTISTLADLTAQTTEILSDDGSRMDVRVTTGDTAPMGHFTLLTDHRIDISRVVLVDTVTDDEGVESESVTNVMYPTDTKAGLTYQGGKPFYLYHGSEGPALSIGANSSKVFRIKYRSYQVEREFAIPEALTAVQGTLDSPKLMVANTLVLYDNAAFANLYGDDVSPRDYGHGPDEHLALPDDASIGDRVIIMTAQNLFRDREIDRPNFFLTPETPAGKVGGFSGEADTDADNYQSVRGNLVTLTYIGGDTGWAFYAAY